MVANPRLNTTSRLILHSVLALHNATLSRIRTKLGVQKENGENTRGPLPRSVVQDCCVSRNPRGGVVMSEKLHDYGLSPDRVGPVRFSETSQKFASLFV